MQSKLSHESYVSSFWVVIQGNALKLTAHIPLELRLEHLHVAFRPAFELVFNVIKSGVN